MPPGTIIDAGGCTVSMETITLFSGNRLKAELRFQGDLTPAKAVAKGRHGSQCHWETILQWGGLLENVFPLAVALRNRLKAIVRS